MIPAKIMYQAIYSDRKSSTIHLWDDVNGYTQLPFKNYAYRIKTGGKFRSILGHELERVTRFYPNEQNLFESDVPMDTRFLIDAYGEDDEPSKQHRLGIIDIEVRTTGGYPKLDQANQPLTSIAMYDDVTKKYRCWVVDEDKEITTGEVDGVDVFSCPDEESLIEAFLLHWEDIKPTIATGWNTSGFDFPYLFNRISRVLGEETACRLSPIGIVHFNRRGDKLIIAGVNCLDYLTMYKWYDGKKLPNYRLDTVGMIELKIGKVKYEGSLNELKKTNIKKFVEYNVHDVRIVKLLDDLKQFVQLAMDICHVCHVGYEEYNVSSKFLEGAVLTYLRRKHLVAPNKVLVDHSEKKSDDDDDDEEGFEGAYVKPPIPGRYEWVCSADINSLYPSTIMSLNISPETKIGKIPDWDTEKYVRKQINKVVLNGYDYTMDQFETMIKEKGWAVACNGAVYDQMKIGCIPDILKKWFTERVEFKKKQKACSDAKDVEGEIFWKRRQQVQKILLNSLYGVLGLPGFRFYDLDNAEAVTLSGQEIIKTSAKFVNARFNKRCGTKDKDYVIYIDTDSLYLDFKSIMDIEKITDPKPFCISLISDTAGALNEFYNVMMPRLFNSTAHRIKIADDVVASSAFWIAKKRYAMRKVYDMELRKDVDKLDFKGIDVVRSSFPKWFRELMTAVLEDILAGKSKAEIDARVLGEKEKMSKCTVEDIAKNTSVRFESNTEPKINFDPKDRSPFTFVNKTTAQAKAGLSYNDFLVKFNELDTEPIMSGGKIKWVYLRENPYGIDGLAFKADGRDPATIMRIVETYIDRPRLWDSEMQTKLVNFYEALGWRIFSVDDRKIEEFFSFDS